MPSERRVAKTTDDRSVTPPVERFKVFGSRFEARLKVEVRRIVFFRYYKSIVCTLGALLPWAIVNRTKYCQVKVAKYIGFCVYRRSY